MPGDLLYIQSGVLYQRVSTDFHIVESVDVGGLIWRNHASMFFQCSCSNGQTIYLSLNFNVRTHVTEHEVVVNECSHDRCDYTSTEKDVMVMHEEGHAHENTMYVVCTYCPKTFLKKNLRHHINTCHRPKEYNDRRCRICNFICHSNNIPWHRRRCVAKQMRRKENKEKKKRKKKKQMRRKKSRLMFCCLSLLVYEISRVNHFL